jgi:hypothetical protein
LQVRWPIRVSGTAGASRRGYSEDGIYFDRRGDCRDSALYKTCSGRWRGVISLGFDADGKRIRKKVSGKTKAEVKDSSSGAKSCRRVQSEVRGERCLGLHPGQVLDRRCRRAFQQVLAGQRGPVETRWLS